jgi:hypothetical protein
MLMRMRHTLAAAVAFTACACSLLVGDGLSGGEDPSAPAGDAGSTVDAGNAAEASSPVADAADADAAVRGVRFRSSSKSQGSGTLSFDRPAGTRAGDLMWAAIWSESSNSITPPTGFSLVGAYSDPSCGNGVVSAIFLRVASASEPLTYSSTVNGVSAAGVLALLDGVATNDVPVVNDALQRISGSSYSPPTIQTPSYETYALATLLNPGQIAATWTTPPGATPLVASNGVAMFVRPAAANQAVDFGASTSSGGCGLAHIALLLVR